MTLGPRLAFALLAAILWLAGPAGAWAQSPQQGSYDDGAQTARLLKDQAQAIPEQQPTVDTAPGFQGVPPQLSNLYGADDAALSASGSAAASSESWNTMRQAGRNASRIAPAETDPIKAWGETINNDPQAFALGVTANGQSGQCQAITNPASNGFYDATCNVGAGVVQTHPTCQVTLDHHLNQTYDYTCKDEKIKGRLCWSWLGWGSCFDVDYTMSSGCTAFAGAGCSLASSSLNTFGSVSGLNFIEGSYAYKCSTPVAGTLTGQSFSWNGQDYVGSFAGPSATPGYVNSTQNVSQCTNNEVTGCPSGAVLEGLQCVTRSPASMTYVCENGFTLVGALCEQTVTQPAAASGYACPAGYTREGDTCVSRVAASPVYSCAAGWTLDGLNCTRAVNQPANAVWTCPTGWSVSGSTCTQYVSLAAGSSFGCPAGWTLSGSTCSQSQTVAAVSAYTCPAGWTLSGSSCSQTTSHPASGGAACPSGWTLNGSLCEQNQTVAATPAYSCQAGWTLSGSTCSLGSTQPASGTPLCNAGDILNGSMCETRTSYGATAAYSCLASEVYVDTNHTCALVTSYTPLAVASTCPTGTAWSDQWSSCVYYTAISSTCIQPDIAGNAFAGSAIDYLGSGGLVCEYQGHGPQGCNAGDFLVYGTCYHSVIRPADATYSCTGAGDVLAASQCTHVATSAPIGTGYSCPAGWTLSGSNCVQGSTAPASVTWSCPGGGTLSGSSCIVTATQAPSGGYACQAGEVLAGSDCVLTSTQAATSSYMCDPGYTLSGTMCIGTQSQAATLSYSCDAGFTLSGAICSGTLTQPATPGYQCPAGQTLSGTQCTGTETKAADISYTCASGTLSGTECVSTAQITPSGFDCPVGYAAAGTGFCSKTTAVAAGQHYACAPAAQIVGNECRAYSNPVSNPIRDLTSECTLESEVCSDTAPETRIVDGVAITQGCWAWTRTYDCKRVTRGNDDCGELAGNPQCHFDHEQCMDDPPSVSGTCDVLEKVYKCPVPGQAGNGETRMLCGGDMYCVNGVCQAVEHEASNELKDALVALGAIDQTQKEFDPNSLTLFKGTRETCHKPIFGLVNCCAGKSSGLLATSTGLAALAGGPAALAAVATQFLTLFLCSSQEKMLDVKDRMGLCHYLGSYCSSSFLGICFTSRRAYCCFQSKLTRILQEQGRPQIGKAWGAPKTESCEGFTADEFSRLDLSVMDFHEIYNEFLEKARLPNEVQMAGEIQQKIQTYYQQNGVH